MLNAAVIGLGWWGRHMLSVLENSPRIRAVAAVDAFPENVREIAARYGVPLTDDYEAVLADKNVDAVIITTPNALHGPQTIAAAQAGKQVFCEKPLALDADTARAMIAACEANGLVLGVGHERRFEGAWEEAKARLDAGRLGTLLHIEVNASYNLFAGSPPSGWRQDPKQAPAGTMTALGVHITDFLQTLGGRVARITAHSRHRSKSYPSNDVLSMHMDFASGATGTFTTIATTPFYQRVTILGDEGWLEIREVSNVDKPGPSVLVWRGLDEEIHTRTYAKADTVSMNLGAWADAIEGKRPYRFTPEELLHNVEILEAIITSADSGAPCGIPPPA